MDNGLRDANHFTMTGAGLEITLVPCGARAVQLGYHGAKPVRTFRGAEVRGERGAAGPSVSVVLSEKDGDRETTLTLIVPHVRVRPGEQAAARTIGITTVRAARDEPEATPGQLGHSTVVELFGTASYVDGVALGGDRPLSRSAQRSRR